MRAVDVEDSAGLMQTLRYTERIGWAALRRTEQVRSTMPFYRVFSKCLELIDQARGATPSLEENTDA